MYFLAYSFLVDIGFKVWLLKYWLIVTGVRTSWNFVCSFYPALAISFSSSFRFWNFCYKIKALLEKEYLIKNYHLFSFFWYAHESLSFTRLLDGIWFSFLWAFICCENDLELIFSNFWKNGLKKEKRKRNKIYALTFNYISCFSTIYKPRVLILMKSMVEK